MSSKSRRAFLYVVVAVMVITQAAFADTVKDGTSEESVAVLNEDVATREDGQLNDGIDADLDAIDNLDEVNTTDTVNDTVVDKTDSNISDVLYEEVSEEEINFTEELLGGIEDSGKSKYQDMVVSYADPYLPVRAKASRESSTVGKMMPGSYADIVERGDEWTKVKSGNVTGYIQNIYVCFDDEATDLAKQINKKLSTAITPEEEKKQQAAASAKPTSGSASGSDLYLLAAIIDWEANNEPYEGKLAVGYVIMNRINAGYGASISAVLLARGQFGGVPNGSGGWSSNFQARINKYVNGANNDCLRAAQDVLAGANNPLNAAYLHFNTHVSSYSQAQQIGNHIFYN